MRFEEVRQLLKEALEHLNNARAKVMDTLDRELDKDKRARLVIVLGKLNMAIGIVKEVESQL
jgi:uncharacterized tellurite resistance protein B-like protein